MATIFKYNDKIYQCMSLEKKLKRLKITKDNIDILFEGDLTSQELEDKFLEITKARKNEGIEDNRVHLYKYINKKNGHTLLSIYSSIGEMKSKDVAKDKSWYDDYVKENENMDV